LLELGDASYSIYLTHGFVLPLCGAILLRLPHGLLGAKAALLVGMLVLSALVGDVVYRTVELPMTRWFQGRRRTAVPAVG
jgi:peptidoglycan/LPS O-acetylase OafA/YrhL